MRSKQLGSHELRRLSQGVGVQPSFPVTAPGSMSPVIVGTAPPCFPDMRPSNRGGYSTEVRMVRQ